MHRIPLPGTDAFLLLSPRWASYPPSRRSHFSC